MIKSKLVAHLVTLPRPFAAPIAICAVILGGIIAGAAPFHLFWAVMAGLFLMAGAHSWNSFHDWAITKFDQGTPEERSRPKEYTIGQNVIETGVLSIKEVFINSIGWFVLSLGFVIPLSLMVTPWVWLPWGLVVLCVPWYSEAKKLWHPEVPLGLGFSTFAIWLGQAAGGKPDFALGALISVPLFLCWGVLAEHVDQADDYKPNWPKGGRSLGMLVAHMGIPLLWSIGWFTTIVFLSQIFLIAIGALAPWTGLTLLAFIPITFGALLIDKEHKKGVLGVLAGILLYSIFMVIGQIMGG